MLVFCRPSEYAIDGDAANYAEQYTDLPGLVERINSSILSKLTPPAVKPTPSTASPTRLVSGRFLLGFLCCPHHPCGFVAGRYQMSVWFGNDSCVYDLSIPAQFFPAPCNLFCWLCWCFPVGTEALWSFCEMLEVCFFCTVVCSIFPLGGHVLLRDGIS